MRWFLAGLFLVSAALLFQTPASALTQAEAQELVASVGCAAEVTYMNSSAFNAYYDPQRHKILVLNPEYVPDQWLRLIVLHEAGHCMQFSDRDRNWPPATGRHELEWDADSFAIRKMAELYGVDAAELNHDVWAWLYREHGYEGDDYDSHGTAVDRITRGNLNRWTFRLEAA